MTDINLTELSDEELASLRNRTGIEAERRARIASIPDQIAEMAQMYRQSGGEQADLETAITEEVS